MRYINPRTFFLHEYMWITLKHCTARCWPFDLVTDLAHYLTAYFLLHLDAGDELSWLDEVADVDARVVANVTPDAARNVEEERLQQKNERRPLVVGYRATTALVQLLLLHSAPQTDQSHHSCRRYSSLPGAYLEGGRTGAPLNSGNISMKVWNLVSWLSGISLKLSPPDVRF